MHDAEEECVLWHGTPSGRRCKFLTLLSWGSLFCFSCLQWRWSLAVAWRTENMTVFFLSFLFGDVQTRGELCAFSWVQAFQLYSGCMHVVCKIPFSFSKVVWGPRIGFRKCCVGRCHCFGKSLFSGGLSDFTRSDSWAVLFNYVLFHKSLFKWKFCHTFAVLHPCPHKGHIGALHQELIMCFVNSAVCGKFHSFLLPTGNAKFPEYFLWKCDKYPYFAGLPTKLSCFKKKLLI